MELLNRPGPYTSGTFYFFNYLFSIEWGSDLNNSFGLLGWLFATKLGMPFKITKFVIYNTLKKWSSFFFLFRVSWDGKSLTSLVGVSVWMIMNAYSDHSQDINQAWTRFDAQSGMKSSKPKNTICLIVSIL